MRQLGYGWVRQTGDMGRMHGGWLGVEIQGLSHGVIELNIHRFDGGLEMGYGYGYARSYGYRHFNGEVFKIELWHGVRRVGRRRNGRRGRCAVRRCGRLRQRGHGRRSIIHPIGISHGARVSLFLSAR